jgi:HEAT repeat protein
MDGRKRTILVVGLLVCGGCGKGSTASWIERLKAPEAATRLQAVHILQERKADAAEVVPALSGALTDEDTYVRRDAARALGVFGEQARPVVPALQGRLRDREPSVRKAAALALSRIDPNLPPPRAPAPPRGK